MQCQTLGEEWKKYKMKKGIFKHESRGNNAVEEALWIKVQN